MLICDPAGTVLAGTDSTLLNEPVARAELAAAPMRSSTTITELGGRSYLIAAAPILSLPANTATRPWRTCARPRPAPTTCCPPLKAALAAYATVGEVCDCLLYTSPSPRDRS